MASRLQSSDFGFNLNYVAVGGVSFNRLEGYETLANDNSHYCHYVTITTMLGQFVIKKLGGLEF